MLLVVIVIISGHILFQIHAVTIIPGKGNESGLFIQPGGMTDKKRRYLS